MAELIVNLSKLRHNVCFIRKLCVEKGVELMAVAKGCNGFLPILRLFQDCGVEALAMSRVRDAIKAEPLLSERPLYLSLPSPLAADAVTRHFGSSLNSEITTVRALAEAAERNGRPHGILLMVDIGDLREGVMPEEVLPTVRSILEMDSPFIRFLGLGATLGCCCGTLPDPRNLGLLHELAEDTERRTGASVQLVSVGGSVVIPALEDGSMPARINQVRIGEAILLGNIPAFDRKHHALSQEGFIFRGAILEVRRKPSMPTGCQGKDVLGQMLHFQDRGPRLRCILDFGVVDTYPTGLTPLVDGVQFINSNSDCTIVDVTDVERDLRPGDVIDFSLNYQALIRALHSQHLKITVVP